MEIGGYICRGGKTATFSVHTLFTSLVYVGFSFLTLLHSERPKLDGVLAVLSAIGFMYVGILYSHEVLFNIKSCEL